MLPANTSKKAVEHGPSDRAPELTWETQEKLLVPGSASAQLRLWQPYGE